MEPSLSLVDTDSLETSGRFTQSKHGKGAYVICVTDAALQIIDVKKASNGAIHGDEVCTQLEDQPAETSSKIQHSKGSVVKVLKRQTKVVIGRSTTMSGNKAVIKPTHKKMPDIVLSDSDVPVNQQWLIISVDSWNMEQQIFTGHVVERLGKIGERTVENHALKFYIPLPTFQPHILSEMILVPRLLLPQEIAGRRDLRHLTILSVDPSDCKDIDDALHAVLLPNGNTQIGVHIADVSLYVKSGSAVDREAVVPLTVIAMLPDVLSTDLCSLRANEIRPAFTVLTEISPAGDIVGSEFIKTVIKSHAALSYDDAQRLLDLADEDDALTRSLKCLRNIAAVLREKRINDGDTTWMVEEAMSAANFAVSKLLMARYRDSVITRCHPPPATEAFQHVIKLAAHTGVIVDVTTNTHISKLLMSTDIRPSVKSVLSSEFARSLAPSFYGSAGYRSSDEIRHTGLGLPFYITFTSPIRRYVDILSHRLVAIAVGADVCDEPLPDKKDLERLSMELNDREEDAKSAERASKMLYLQLYARTHRVREPAVVTTIAADSVGVRTLGSNLDGKVIFTDKPDDPASVAKRDKQKSLKLIFDKEEPSLRIGSVTIHIWDEIIVDLESGRLNPHNQWNRFSLVEPRIPGFNDRKRTVSDKIGSTGPGADDSLIAGPSSSSP